jgi:hypothetical protein
MGQKILHLQQCTASVNKAPTSFYLVSTITHLTVPLTRQKCYCMMERHQWTSLCNIKNNLPWKTLWQIPSCTSDHSISVIVTVINKS